MHSIMQRSWATPSFIYQWFKTQAKNSGNTVQKAKKRVGILSLANKGKRIMPTFCTFHINITMNVFFNLKKAYFSNFSKGKEKNIHADLCVPVYFSLLHTAHLHACECDRCCGCSGSDHDWMCWRWSRALLAVDQKVSGWQNNEVS